MTRVYRKIDAVGTACNGQKLCHFPEIIPDVWDQNLTCYPMNKILPTEWQKPKQLIPDL